ncbi:alkaline phosphatase [Stomoxys calcitrans]|uniref:Alkaline phosphatase n=1 Tax=Stomoxys calcitrans TaxID=35570 RepID=A0A1I8Q1Q8_STOCA|nr:alkaline phosphatase [Stomoxys calcitrans]
MKAFVVILGFLGFTLAISVDDTHIHAAKKLVGKNSASPTGRFFENVGYGKTTPSGEVDPEYWRALARSKLKSLVEETYNYKQAKNVIFFLGDGMSLNTLTASRIRKGQLKGNPGEEDQLSFEKFPHVGLTKTYCTNVQVSDSACTATAYLCGVKANSFTLGVSAKVEYDNCSMSMDTDNQLSSLADWAQKAGKSTGFITTTTLTHASPAGLYAKSANRKWESDTDIPPNVKQEGPCMDIAQQLIKRSPGRNFDVIMGGGMGKFLPNTVVDVHGTTGERSDGLDLLGLWKDMHPRGVIVSNRDELLNVNVSKATHIMGIFHSDLMDYHSLADPATKPTLSEMTEAALNHLSRNENGYFIFIEGGLIDQAHHSGQAKLSLDETLEMEKAVQLAVTMTNAADTLIVVTSDHGHPLTIAGYPDRGTDILGLNQDDVDSNGIKYASLNYAVGSHQYLDENGKRINLEGIISDEPGFIHPSQIPIYGGVHSGEDVGVFARGPHSHLFRGVMEQNTIPHLIGYAACIGEGATLCNSKL